MKLSIAALAAYALVGATAALAQRPELTQQQSPARPAPEGLKIIDQGANDPRLKGYFTPEGLKVEIVADFPVVQNPVGMTFGDDGSLYVLEWRKDLPGAPNFPEHAETVHYKDGTTRQIWTMKKGVKDVVKVLRDTKGNGSYDEAKVILEEELPSSILLHDGWIYLSGRGSVKRYRQSKPDGPYDVREVIAQGFCGYHHHQVSGMTIGNDGWLYLTTGDNDNYVEGSDGSRATVLRTGAVFRCRPDGSRMQVYSIGYRNPYRDVAFDTEYNVFHADNDQEDGSKFTGCRLMHVAEGSDFGWRLRIGARCCSSDFVRGAVFGELPGKMPAMLKTGRGAPAGLLIYNDSRFPESYRGLLYYPDVFRKLIRAYRVEPAASTFQVTEEFEFLKSSDPLFRPCQMVLGPDGAMYICDWRTDSGGAGRLWGDGKHGRIYRVSWAGTKEDAPLPLRGLDSWAKIGKLSDDELLDTLSSSEFSDRQRAQRELARRGQYPRLRQLLRDQSKALAARIAALGGLECLETRDKAPLLNDLMDLLNDKETDLRRLAADGLALNAKPGDKKVTAALLERLGDPEPSVRRAIALAMGHVAAPGVEDSLVNAYKFEDTDDVYLRDGILRAIELTGKRGIDKLLALAESGDERDRNRVVEAFLGLRIRAGAQAIPTFLDNPHLTSEQRAGLLRSYSNYLLDPPVSLEPVVDYLMKNPGEATVVKLAGLEALSQDGALKGDKGQALILALLQETDPPIRLAVIKVIADTHLVQAVPRLTKLLADETRPAAERLAVIKALRVLSNKSPIAVLKNILGSHKQEDAGALRLESLRTLARLDPAAAQAPARAFLDQNDLALQSDAIQVLGTQVEGAKLVGERFLAKKLPRELLQQVTDALQKHAAKDPEVARMLTEVMKSGLLLSLNKEEVERVRQLVHTKGDAKRGRAVYLDSKKLACINCHRLEGIGGNVGPDLTRIWETQTVEKIMESIIEPSKEIKEGYQTYVATTKDGQVFTGVKVAQTAEELILRDANDREVHIAAADLDEVTPSKESLMPANVVAQLTFSQFIDLIAFLKDRAAQESLRGMAVEFWVLGPIAGDLKTPHPAEGKTDVSATYQGERGEKLSWQVQRAEPSGLLNVRALFHRDNVAVYAFTHVYSPTDQKVKLVLGSDDPLKVWVNNTVIHENSTPGSAAPDQHRVEVPLQAGWNPVLVKVVNAPSGHGFYLRFTGGPGLRVALKPEGK